MKNKFILIITSVIFFSFANLTCANEFKFEAEVIEFLEDGNIIKGLNDVQISDDKDEIKITGNILEYNKLKSILEISENVYLKDYLTKTNIDAEKIIYLKNEEKIISIGKANINLKENYNIKTKNLTYFKDLKKIQSDEESFLSDNLGNKITLGKFKYLMNESIIKGTSINYLDVNQNKYFFENAIIDLNLKKILGKDLSIDFQNGEFVNNANQPRLKGTTAYFDVDKTIVTKGVFTTCKKRNDKCPPWEMSASEVLHDKNKKTINYKNAWLKLYDKPVFYFPKFFHPDPTVKRQSGFLMPRYSSSNTLGSSLQIPYFGVISDNKDFTLTPRLFSRNNFIIQSEYRHVKKNSEHIMDFSLNRKNKVIEALQDSSTNTHFFSNSVFDMGLKNYSESNLTLNLSHSSHDTYLKTYNIKSPLITSPTTLNSYMDIELYNDDFLMQTSFEIYEDLNKITNDRFEYVYPNVTLTKDLDQKYEDFGGLTYNFNGYQKQYDTNVYEAVLVNDLIFESNSRYLENGVESKYSLLLKNVNTNSDNSTNYKNYVDSQILTSALFERRYPLKKKGEIYDSYLTPIMSMRFSPNQTKNLLNNDRRIDINNIYSFNRIGRNDAVENGLSLTLGSEYKKRDKSGTDLLSLSLASSFRNDTNEDIPIKSGLGKKSSDLVGNFSFYPSEYLDFSYDFSIDNNLDNSNYDSIKTTISVNNFITTFEYLEENNFIGDENYLSNKTSYGFDENKSINFSTRRNKKTDLTEFYNLVYEYKNDCLTAAIEYNKTYYTDNDLKPEEQLYFSITIVPFGKTTGPNLTR